MSFPRYEEYKDSGHPWIGSVPSHWAIERFRKYFHESPEKIVDQVVGVMLSVSGYRGIEIKEYDDENRRRTDEELVNYRIVRPGQLVVNSMWLNAGGLGVSVFEGHVSPAYRSYWIDNELSKWFVHHLLRSSRYVDGYTSMVQGIRPNSLQLSREDLMNLPVLIPPKDEQQAIASFLDRETSKIDALVSEQRRLVELLKEKRQAVISHAVTKGLDPTVPMKPSGIPWLGDVPAHWEVKPLKYLADIKTGYAFNSEAFVTEGVPVIRIGDIGTDGAVDFSEAKYLPVNKLGEHEDAMVRQNDIVMAMTGATIGKAATYTLAGPALLNQRVCVFRTFDSSSQRFLWHMLQTYYYTEYLAVTAFGGAQPNISDRELVGCPFPIPPLSEQVRIAEFLDREVQLFSQLQAQANRAIALLQERRTALISAAVIGKIDVRNA
jgi:type I restriction enzyme S subunit